MRQLVIFMVLFTLLCSFSYGQNLSSGFSTTPQFVIPVGSKAANYQSGIGFNLEGLFSFGEFQYLSTGVEFGYIFSPLDLGQPYFSTDDNLSLLNLGLTVRGALPLSERFSAYLKLGAGGSYAALHGTNTGQAIGLTWNTGLGFTMLFNNKIGMQLGASYNSYLDIYDGIAINIGINNRFGGPGSAVIPREDFVPTRPGMLPGGGNIEFYDVEVTKVFPVLYKYYATHPIGTATVRNTGKKDLTDVEFRFSMAQFMDAPILSARIEKLEIGDEEQIDIYALFTEDILSITEGTKLASELKADYLISGTQASDSMTITLETWHRNAMMWDDDRKVAAFVTPRDEEIQKTARNVASIVRDEGLASFNGDFQTAMALLGVMDVFGCAYVVDPKSSYADLSADASAIDSVQFPRQTLQYRAGDCDDLSTTYNALLEAVAIPSAYITVPGHIYSAFKLDISEAEAKRTFSRSHDLVFYSNPDNTDDSRNGVWVPVETTALSEGFLNAWTLGSRQWREHDANGHAELISVEDAWQIYEPVAFGVSQYELEIPDRDELQYLFRSELDDFVDSEISARERSLLARIERDSNDKRSLNSLGVLYARYGKSDEARQIFQENGDYAPSTVNLANLYYLDSDYGTAKKMYSQVLNMEPGQPSALLGLSRIAHIEENHEESVEYYNQLKAVSPPLARKYAYLSDEDTSASRASSYLDQSILWDE